MNVYMCSSVSQRVLCFFASSVPFAPDWPLTVHRFKLKNKPTGSWPYEPLNQKAKRKSNGPVVLFIIRKDPTHVIFICVCICMYIYIYNCIHIYIYTITYIYTYKYVYMYHVSTVQYCSYSAQVKNANLKDPKTIHLGPTDMETWEHCGGICWYGWTFRPYMTLQGLLIFPSWKHPLEFFNPSNLATTIWRSCSTSP